MLEQDATAACGERHERGERRQAHRWGRTKGKIGFHGGKVAIERPRVRGLDGAERVLPSWENAVSEDLLGKWAMNQMLINVSTRRFKRSVRLPEGDVPASDGAGLSKSATSRRFVALSAARMRAWMETRLDDLDLLTIQIDGIHMGRGYAPRRGDWRRRERRQTSARPRRGRDRKRNDGAGAHR
jgi:putative transposase